MRHTLSLPKHTFIPVAVESSASNDRSRYVSLFVVGGATAGLLTRNPLLTPISILFLLPIAWLTWRRGEPPALIFACAMHWLQAAAAIFYTNFFGTSLTDAFGGLELEGATWLSLIGVLTLAVGMRIGLLRAGRPQSREFAEEGLRIDVGKAFVAYIISFASAFAFAVAAAQVKSLSQPLLFLATFKWLFVFGLSYVVFEQRTGYRLLILAVVLEIAVGFLGFFGNFRSVFFVLIVAVTTSPLALRGRRLLLLASAAVVLVLLASTWTAIKSDYRAFLNQGFQTQEVLVPVEERVGKLQDLVAGFDVQQLAEGFETMIMRVSYVQFFALTIKNVPEHLPYEDGALWGGALKHVVTPRLLFPNKPAIDDSERTSYYTGVTVAGAEQGTSIGIGYFGESYIDFGPVLMFVPILLLGVAYGLIYRFFVLRAQYKILGGAIATSIMVFSGSLIETSNIKIVGGGVTVLFVMSVFYVTLAPAMMRWLRAR